MGEFGGYLPHDRTTIGDLLKRAGYRCGIVGPWHLGDDHRPQHGFSDFWCTYRYLTSGTIQTHSLIILKPKALKTLSLKCTWNDAVRKHLEFGTITDPRQQRTTWTIDRSLEFIQQQDDDAPFFLFASVKDPHPRILVPPELPARYQEEEMPLPASLRDPLMGNLNSTTRKISHPCNSH